MRPLTTGEGFGHAICMGEQGRFGGVSKVKMVLINAKPKYEVCALSKSSSYLPMDMKFGKHPTIPTRTRPSTSAPRGCASTRKTKRASIGRSYPKQGVRD